jgi:predicted ATPase
VRYGRNLHVRARRGPHQELCQRLDRLPLAIELAAARVNALSVQQIVERLDDRFRLLGHPRRMASPRQETLRATLDWSYALLSDEERLLADRLAVFAGGCSLEAVEAVCSDDGIPPDRILELVSTLVDKSLINTEHSPDGMIRYGVLESIRQYARARLQASGQLETIRLKHALFYASLAEHASRSRVADSDLTFGELELEHDNLRSAFAG